MTDETVARNGWQPIETAPADTPILVWDGSGMAVCIRLNSASRRDPVYYVQNCGSNIWTDDGVIEAFGLTHWRHLPDPPATE